MEIVCMVVDEVKSSQYSSIILDECKILRGMSINMDKVEVEQIEWLFYPFIPYGKVTIIQGDPGEGKTTTGGENNAYW